MKYDANHEQQDTPALAQELRYRIQQLGPARDALANAKCKPSDIGYLSSGERTAALLAARLEKEVDFPLFAFLKLDADLQAFVLYSRGRADLIGARIADMP